MNKEKLNNFLKEGLSSYQISNKTGLTLDSIIDQYCNKFKKYGISK